MMEANLLESTADENSEEMDPALVEHLRKLDEKGVSYQLIEVPRRNLRID